ncbi:uncharacterized protein LOC121737203 [Aricia agestis]|uniref:uncharacterized protein LOC121737203 n=1 Tax=Aricia agestis TaxID=91739 RepID=UPI001C209CE4|nr:uncharacterized protein LOC121737203 [Aricia agestis]
MENPTENQAEALPVPQQPAAASATTSNDVNSIDLAAISVQSRLLPFWREYPDLWFNQFEALVLPMKTSDDNKFRYVLGQLQATDLRHLTDILSSPPQKGKYEAVKTRLLYVYGKSQVTNFKHLLSELELGDQKPSQLLRRMRELAGNMLTEDGIKIEWLNRLPQQVRVVLSVNKDSPLDVLAAMADKMLEYSSTSTIAAIATSPPTQYQHQPGPAPSTSNEIFMATQIQLMAKQIEKLTLEVAEIRQGRQRQHYPRHSRSRSRSMRRQYNHQTNKDEWLCRYHYKFGDQARQCISPCARRNRNSEN